MVGAMSMTWWNWLRMPAAVVDFGRPRDHQTVAGAAEVRGYALHPLERRRIRPKPSRPDSDFRVAARRSRRCSGSCEATSSGTPFCVIMLLVVPVEAAFGARAIVAGDEDDQRVVGVGSARIASSSRPTCGPCGQGSRQRLSCGGHRAASRRRRAKSHAAISSGRVVRTVFCGTTPSFFCRSSVSSRTWSQP